MTVGSSLPANSFDRFTSSSSVEDCLQFMYTVIALWWNANASDLIVVDSFSSLRMRFFEYTFEWVVMSMVTDRWAMGEGGGTGNGWPLKAIDLSVFD